MSALHYLPDGWKRLRLHQLASIQTGVAKGKKDIKNPIECPYLRVANVQDGHLDLAEIKTIRIASNELNRYLLRHGDVLMTEGGDFDKLGRGFVWEEQIPGCLHQNHVFAVRPDAYKLDSFFLSYQTGSSYGKGYFVSCSKQSTNLASINSSQLKEYPVLLPSLKEQKVIVQVVQKWDRSIDLTERLIAAKQERRKWFMQQLLTGKQRLPKFKKSKEFRQTPFGTLPADWGYPRIGDVAREVSERNGDQSERPVLSCTKHQGLVDSLTYFGKRIFSEDLSNYKIVCRSQFAYATNHIDEGSIGYQGTYDEALISPIYTVFQTNETMDDRFLFLILKTETYRHIFSSNTSASVDRRGSLRWGDFAKIHVPLPSMEEQKAIVKVIHTADREIDLLRKQLDALHEQKKGLMQQLLTGKVRVKV